MCIGDTPKPVPDVNFVGETEELVLARRGGAIGARKICSAEFELIPDAEPLLTPGEVPNGELLKYDARREADPAAVILFL